MEAIQRASASTSTPDPSVGEEGLQDDLDMIVRADASSLDTKAARILSEVVVAMWEVHRLWEILPTASRVLGYSCNTKKIKSCVFNNQDSGLNTK
jgi:hypothetical protein